MAATIPETRAGRALRAGIPIALILLGAELLQGSWKIERSVDRTALSWSPGSEGTASVLAIRLTSCAEGRCTSWNLPLSLRPSHLGAGMAAFAAVIWPDCPEQRQLHLRAFLG